MISLSWTWSHCTIIMWYLLNTTIDRVFHMALPCLKICSHHPVGICLRSCSHFPVVGYWGSWQFPSINQCCFSIFLPPCVSVGGIHTTPSHLCDQHGRPWSGQTLVSCCIMGGPEQEAIVMRVFNYFSNSMSKPAASGWMLVWCECFTSVVS